MKMPAFIRRRAHWINLPSALLVVLLQRLPAVNVVTAADEIITGARAGTVLKSMLATIATLGAVNSMAGATPLTAQGGGSTSTGVTVTAGVAMSAVSFSVGSEATAPDPTASWNVNAANGSSFPPGLNFSGLTGDGNVDVTVLKLQGTPTTAGTYQVTLEAVSRSGSFMSSIFTYTVTVNPAANSAPSITTQPTNQTITAGNSVTFTSGANGSPAPTFQWQKDNVNINGATSATFSIASVSPGDAGTYKLVATNSAGSATSNGAVLTVNFAPSFTTQPQEQTVTAGSPVTFTSAATGNPTPTFQWRKNGVNIGGATSATFSIPSTVTGDAGTYSVVATNSVNSATSNGALLTVNPAAILPNFTLQPVSQSIAAGHPVMFTVAATGTPSPAYRWRRQPLGGAPVDLADNANFAGTGTATLTISGTTTAMNGDTYTCVASNAAGPVTSNPATLMVAPGLSDFNGDGQSDILWQDMVTGERAVWFMNGTAFWSSADITTIGADWVVAATADFNGDGQVDLLWQNTVTGERLIWLMNGTAFGSSVALGTIPIEWSAAAAGDLDGDGKADIVWQNRLTGERLVWFMNGTSFSSAVSLGVIPTEWEIAGMADFDGDGHSDLLWVNLHSGEVRVWLMNGTNVGATPTVTTVTPQFQISGVGDYNADGKPDILVTNTVTGERSVWLMNGTAIASSASLTTLPLEWVLNRPLLRRVAADFNGDANSDIVWQNTATGERLIWLMSGSSFLASAPLATIPPEWQIAATGDFNSDGKPDLVWQNTSTGERVIWLMDGTTFLSSVSLGVIPAEWSIVATGDLDANGTTDIFWQNFSTGERVVWFMSGTAFLSGGSFGIIPTEWSIAGAADFNGDGYLDILWQNSSTGERLVWFMNGPAFVSAGSLGVISTDWSIAGTGDFNSDGNADILWQNTSTGERALWLMNGPSFASGLSLGVIPVEWWMKD